MAAGLEWRLGMPATTGGSDQVREDAATTAYPDGDDHDSPLAKGLRFHYSLSGIKMRVLGNLRIGTRVQHFSDICLPKRQRVRYTPLYPLVKCFNRCFKNRVF